MERFEREDVQRVSELLDEGRNADVLSFLESHHPADVADILQELTDEHKLYLLHILGNDVAADVLTEVDERSGQTLLELLPDRDVATLLGEMPSDDAVDLIAQLTPEKSEHIKSLMPSDDRARIHELLEFHEESAGGIMESETLAIPERATIRDVIRLVRAQSEEIENIQKVYVISDSGALLGSIRILDLLLHEPEEPVISVMDKNIISVPVTMDQEEVANLFGRYDEFSLPVVDAENRLIGRIMVDDIIDVMEEEASEDITKLAGTDEDEIGERSPFKISRSRLPWLVGGLFGQVLNALLLSKYEAPLHTAVTLVFFIPLLIGIAGSIGSQAAVVVVRELALKEIDMNHLGRRFFRELQVALLNGVILSSILFTVIYLWQHDVGLGVLLCVSLMTVVCFTSFLGASFPLLLDRLKIDPAVATGPFITVASDMTGIAIYLTLATIYLSMIQ